MSNLKGFLFLAVSTSIFSACLANVLLSLGKTPIGARCSTSDNCVAAGLSSCKENLCQCLSKYVASTNNLKCLQISDLGQPCEEPQQCKAAGASCRPTMGFKYCLCDDDYALSDNHQECKKKVKLGDSCDNDELCMANNSTCTPNGCACDGNYVGSRNRDKCLAKINQIGNPCEEDDQCISADVTCDGTSRTCVCKKESQVPSGDKTKCLPAAMIEGICIDDGQCLPLHPDGASCTGGECTCNKGTHIPSADNGRCLLILNDVDEPCVESSQCREGQLGINSECQGGTCQCSSSSFHSNKTCKALPRLNDTCHNHDECQLGLGQHAHCNSSSNDEFEFKCACKPESVQDGSMCRMRILGDPCQADANCTATIRGEVECDECSRTCQCKLGYKQSQDGTSCYFQKCADYNTRG